MSKKITFSSRFPRARIIFMIAVVIAIPMTVWSLNHVPTNISQNAAGTSNNSSLSVKMVLDANKDGLLNFNDTITFDVSTNQTNHPFVNVICYKDNELVYSNTAGFYPSYPKPAAQNMVLSSARWSGGAADCTARLIDDTGKNIKSNNFASVSFHVNQ